MRVWIDQDLCTGDGLCVEICPPLFAMYGDGLAYVKEAGEELADPPRLQGTQSALVPADLIESAIEAAEECPGECIFFDLD